MDYFKVNYNSLAHLKIKKYSLFIFLIVIGTVGLFSYAYVNKISKRINFYGIYDGLVLKVMANKDVTEAIKNNHVLVFNKKKVQYEVSEFKEYEITNNVIWQEIDLIVDSSFYENEVGEGYIEYPQAKIITFILELFK